MVFISLLGTAASGKATVCDYLVQRHGFKHLRIERGQSKGQRLELRDGNVESAPPTSSAFRQMLLDPSPADISESNSFPDAGSLLNFVTKSWQDSYVTLDLCTAEDLEPFVKRPFFLVVGVDGPIGRRYERSQRRLQARGQNLTLQQFIDQHDFDMNASSTSTFSQTSGPSLNPRPLDHNASPTSSSFPFNHARSSPSLTSRGQRGLLNEFAFNGSREGADRSRLEEKGAIAGTSEAGSLRKAMAYAQVMVLNNFETKEELWMHLDELDLLNGERLRPGWDTYFMTLASLASLRSNCMKRRVGALLVRSKRILSTGYNGTPRGLANCNEGGCARCNGAANGGQGCELLDYDARSNESGRRDGASSPAARSQFRTFDPQYFTVAECLCLHAEENALLEVGRERIGENAILYCNTCPCLTCSVKIVQTGVKEVVYNLNYSMDEASARVLKEGGVILRQLVMPSATT